MDDHGERLLSIIAAKVRNEAEAEDIRQEVFAEYLEAYDLGQVFESLGAWLVQVAQNKIIDRFRRGRTEQGHRVSATEADDSRTSGDPESEWTDKWIREEIAEALDMLPAEQRDVFVRHELEGQSFEEIALATGENVNTLLSRKRYAILFLREHLKEVYNGLE